MGVPGVTREEGFGFGFECEVGIGGSSFWGGREVGEGEREVEGREEVGEESGEEGRGAVIEKGICLLGWGIGSKQYD